MSEKKKFMSEDFLLDSEAAKWLYHTASENLPIIDYHCHVPPKDIAEDKKYSNITELWLGGDHYKWRAIRSAGVDEKYITGDASDYEKFRAYARVMPRLIGNPLYHWTHLELRRYFDCDLILSEKTCDEIWHLTADALAKDDFSVKNIIRRSNVEVICTTDDPADSLEYHSTIAADDNFKTKVYPAFRPDKGINIEAKGYRSYISRLSEVSGVKIKDLDSLFEAYMRRLDFFEQHGCSVADHGLDIYPFYVKPNAFLAENAFQEALANDGYVIAPEKIAAFKGEMLRFFGHEYRRRGWVMQIHFGVLRNANSVMFKKLGPDTGFDTIGTSVKIDDLAKLFDMLSSSDSLPRTILYPINPSDNAAVAALIGSFQTSSNGMPQMMQGSAWWFNDTLHGMKEQMTTLASLSVFGSFLGMLTDSRSFTSYPRHEYFRRILCSLVGGWLESGLYGDDDTAAEIVRDISYFNAKRYFGF